METLAIGVVVLVLGCCLILPIVAILRTRNIRSLERRLSGVEAALLRLMREQAAQASPEAVQRKSDAPLPEAPQPTSETPPAMVPTSSEALPPRVLPVAPTPLAVSPSESLEAVIGERWLAWVAILLIFFAAGFFLKYAFENRWIGELGRVTLGVAVGLVFTWGGLNRSRLGWRYLSQVLTGGGITILYLSVYGAFAYYHLIDQRSAFVFLAIVVVEAHLLALSYNAPAVAVTALVGGFLAPVLLSTGRDQYRVLFTYIGALDLGVLGVVLARRWRWIGSLAYVGTQFLFWAWYGEHYHPEKRAAALLFQAAIFLLFALADLAPHLKKQAAGSEEWVRLAVNPFVFYATCYSLLDGDHHDWMGALALVMAIVYAALARAELALRPSDRRMLLVTLGAALTFVTLAVPVQLDSNWITIAWGVEGLALLWAGFETAAPPLRVLSAVVFSLALLRYLYQDTPWEYRPAFTPVLNRYFLGTLALAACLGGAAYLCRRWGRGAAPGGFLRASLVVALLAAGVVWLGSSVEAYSYFDAQAGAVRQGAEPQRAEAAKQLRWAGQLSLSLLWSVYAALLTAAGFRLRLRAWRVAGLVLFGITLVKVIFVDISELRQFYRIIALLALGLLLLRVAWAYQRSLRREQTK